MYHMACNRDMLSKNGQIMRFMAKNGMLTSKYCISNKYALLYTGSKTVELSNLNYPVNFKTAFTNP